jgi:hypothetical protein
MEDVARGFALMNFMAFAPTASPRSAATRVTM